LVSSVIVLVILEALVLGPFVVLYVASRGFDLAISVFLALSSTAYYATALLSARILRRIVAEPRLVLLAALFSAAAVNSASLAYVVLVYNRHLISSWETLSFVLSLSNIYALLAIDLGSLEPDSLGSYLAVNTATLVLIPWAAVCLAGCRIESRRDAILSLRRAAVAVALGVKLPEYLVLVFWLVSLFLPPIVVSNPPAPV